MLRFRPTAGSFILSASLLGWCAWSWAQDSAEVPNPPSMPTEDERAHAEQAAKHRAAEDKTEAIGVQTKDTVVGTSKVTEYSRGGQVFMLRVKPKNAPAQYIDESLPGGTLTPNDEGLSQDTNLPKWRLGSF